MLYVLSLLPSGGKTAISSPQAVMSQKASLKNGDHKQDLFA
jgi:hypothetical protein